MQRYLTFLLVACSLTAAEKVPTAQLLDMGRHGAHSAQFRDALVATLGEAEIQKGTAVLGEGPDFLWAVEAEKTPVLYVDDDPAGPMKRLNGSRIWFHEGKLATGTSHLFYYVIDGARFGGKTDVPAYTPDSYTRSGVAQGKLSGKFVNISKIYPGMESNYWIYVPAEYQAGTPAALMVWQDGEKYTTRDGPTRLMNVIDNLIYEKKIPVMIQVLISPGLAEGKRMRSIEYDTVSDRYARFLEEDILAEVRAKYDLRKDGYSRGIGGESSGGICSFNVAWFQPDHFSRVLSRIGSFTSIQWHPGEIDGGNVYPFKIRKEPKRNIRVWLQDGSNDLENEHGSWPLQNIQMANSLKRMDYDFHFTFGNGTHNTSQGNAQLPEALTWLWRDYDPHKTEQVYEMEASEKAKPLFRVKIYNRD